MNASPNYEKIGLLVVAGAFVVYFLLSGGILPGGRDLDQRLADHGGNGTKWSVAGESRIARNALSFCCEAIPDAKLVPAFAGIAANLG